LTGQYNHGGSEEEGHDPSHCHADSRDEEESAITIAAAQVLCSLPSMVRMESACNWATETRDAEGVYCHDDYDDYEEYDADPMDDDDEQDDSDDGNNDGDVEDVYWKWLYQSDPTFCQTGVPKFEEDDDEEEDIWYQRETAGMDSSPPPPLEEEPMDCVNESSTATLPLEADGASGPMTMQGPTTQEEASPVVMEQVLQQLPPFGLQDTNSSNKEELIRTWTSEEDKENGDYSPSLGIEM